MIIGLAGYARAGKNTIAREIRRQDPSFSEVSFAAKLKSLAYRLNPEVGVDRLPLRSIIDSAGWERAKDNFPYVRTYLQKLGQGVRDHVGPDVWVDAALPSSTEESANLVVTDVRYPNEILRIHALGGKVAWIHREGIGPVNGHESENSVADAADYVLNNSGEYPQDAHLSVSDMLMAFYVFGWRGKL